MRRLDDAYDGKKIAQLVHEIFQVQAFFDTTTHTLMVAGSTAQLKQVGFLLDILDKASPYDPSAAAFVYPLQTTKAVDLAASLQYAFEHGLLRDEFRENVPVLVTADPRTNSLVVWSKPRDVDSIKRILEELDHSPNTPATATRGN